MSTTRIGPKHQVTIPKDVFENLNLEVGDFLDVQVSGDAIAMIPQKLIPKDQAWFHTREWQNKEREADRAIARGAVSGPFTSAEALLKHLGKRKGSRKKVT
jgi:AbrB family looped-hinge helix DNA binding protein